MTDFQLLASVLATALKGKVLAKDDGGDRLPKDIAHIALAGEGRDGLLVVLRPGHSAEKGKVVAVMSQTMASRRGADYHSTPSLHDFRATASMARPVDAIAKHIEKNIAPAVAKLAEFNAKMDKRDADRAALAATADRYRAAFPKARIDLTQNGDSCWLYLATATGGFIDGELNADGGLYIKRSSRLPEAATRALLNLL